MKLPVLLLLLGLASGTPACPDPGVPPAAASAPDPVEAYVERYLETFPTRATAAGRHDHDSQLGDFSAASRRAWVDFNRTTAHRLRMHLADPATAEDDRLDAELVLRQAELVVFDHTILRIAERDPLWWTGILSNATVFLLVREDLPAPERLRRAAARAGKLPRLVAQARAALASGDPASIPRSHVEMAARQARASAGFYRRGFAEVARANRVEDLAPSLASAGQAASAALDELADFLDALAENAAGSSRLGTLYAERFRLVTGLEAPVDEVLVRAEAALAEKRVEVATYGRQVWSKIFPGTSPPDDDHATIARLFARVAEDHAATPEDFIAQYRGLVDEVVEFVRQHQVVTMPEPLTLWVGRSPSYFLGQSVGGVYPAGPWEPEAETLLFLPTPPDDATPEQKAAFFRDFNDHFNRMITPHELLPGHYLQLKWAARHPRKARALFADGVYVEGWGTFCERLLLDLGWGGPLDRLAHLKKQLENIARTIVDIRVHTRGMTREDVLTFVQDEALQDAQFASNMWRRAITSSPQLTTYFLGFEEVWGLYEDVRAARAEDFVLRDFTDGMMELGPVAVEKYRARMLSHASKTLP